MSQLLISANGGFQLTAAAVAGDGEPNGHSHVWRLKINHLAGHSAVTPGVSQQLLLTSFCSLKSLRCAIH
jgi:hypothetical protein